MIAYAFPPEGSAAVYRPLRFVRHLPAVGWQASVISADTDRYERYDPDLLSAVPPATAVDRVPCRDPWQVFQARRAQRLEQRVTGASIDTGARLGGAQGPIRCFLREAVRRAEAWCYHPDMAMPWIPPAVDATVRSIERGHADVVWATAGPVSSFVVAQRASLRTGVPYVLDFRDAWTITYNDFEHRRPGWATRRDRRSLYRLLGGAQAVTFRYQTEAECYWRAYPGALDASRIHVIPNGYEGAIDDSVRPRGNTCTILYSGTLSSYRYDTLLLALCQLKETDAKRATRLRLRVVGEGSEALAATAAALGLAELVETTGPTSHDEVIRLQREADALLVLGRPPSFRGHELFAAAKLFGYMKAGRPIVGVLPADETRKILQRVGVSTLADAGSVPQITALLRQVAEAWSEGTLSSLVPDRAACEAYSAVHQTAALARALEGRCAAEPFVPNAVTVPRSLLPHIRDSARANTSNSPGRNAFLHP
jgi:hypothetical protein